MAAQAGPSIQAIGARQDAVAARAAAAGDADATLAAALAGAHAATVDGLARLDAIGADIEERVAQHAVLAADTAAGARELQKFLIAQHREIIAVLSAVQQQAAARTAQLQALRARYSGG